MTLFSRHAICTVQNLHLGLCRSNKTLGELDLVDSSHAAAQLSMHITPSRVQVTSEDNFWAIMLQVWPVLLCLGHSIHLMLQAAAQGAYSTHPSGHLLPLQWLRSLQRTTFWATMLQVAPGEQPSGNPRGHCHCR